MDSRYIPIAFVVSSPGKVLQEIAFIHIALVADGTGLTEPEILFSQDLGKKPGREHAALNDQGNIPRPQMPFQISVLMKEATIPVPALTTPMQLGPQIRMPKDLATASALSCKAAPRGPVSANPAL
jgi:hypothetical protein